MAYFVGQEVVFHREQAVWSMSYAYGFLRLALQRGKEAEPYRGPADFSRESWVYTNASSGGLEAFSGIESISRDGTQVYQCRYAGGVPR
jgi:hypothetical protein